MKNCTATATATWTRRLVASGLVAGSFLFTAGPANALPAPQRIREGVSRPALVETTTQNDVRVAPSAATLVTAWPTGESKPLASNLDVPPGDVRPNLVIVKAGGRDR